MMAHVVAALAAGVVVIGLMVSSSIVLLLDA
jgi:hypothetical protein